MLIKEGHTGAPLPGKMAWGAADVATVWLVLNAGHLAARRAPRCGGCCDRIARRMLFKIGPTGF